MIFVCLNQRQSLWQGLCRQRSSLLCLMIFFANLFKNGQRRLIQRSGGFLLISNISSNRVNKMEYYSNTRWSDWLKCKSSTLITLITFDLSWRHKKGSFLSTFFSRLKVESLTTLTSSAISFKHARNLSIRRNSCQFHQHFVLNFFVQKCFSLITDWLCDF